MNHSQAHTLESIDRIMEAMGVSSILDSGRLEINIKIDDLMRLTELSGCDVK